MLIENSKRSLVAMIRLMVTALVSSLVVIGMPNNANAATQSCSASTPAVKRPTVKSGDKGSCVKDLQRRLNTKGAKLSVDGDFGSKTKTAVVSYQRKNRLTADGIVGLQTWSLLLGTTNVVTTPKPKPPTATTGNVDNCWQSGSQVWLSFDDSASSAQLNSILNTLKKKNVKAYFFFRGDWAKSNPSLMKRIKADGHYVGNHTYDHPSLTSLSESGVRYQIKNGIAGNSNPKLLRPPYGNGAKNANIQKIAGSMGYKTCYWTVDSKDWDKSVTTSSTVLRNRILYGDKYTPPVKPGGMVLMHGHGRYTASALPSLIDGIRARGMKLPPLR